MIDGLGAFYARPGNWGNGSGRFYSFRARSEL